MRRLLLGSLLLNQIKYSLRGAYIIIIIIIKEELDITDTPPNNIEECILRLHDPLVLLLLLLSLLLVLIILLYDMPCLRLRTLISLEFHNMPTYKNNDRELK